MNYRIYLIFIFGTLVSACDSRTLEEGGIGGTGMIAGTATQVAELNINGKKINTDNATFLRNEEEKLTLQDAISVGEYVNLITEESASQIVAEEVAFRSPVTGTVQIDESDLTKIEVLGQTVRIDELVLFTGFSVLTEIVDGDFIEISGYRSGDIITATVVRRISDASTLDARVTGSIDSIDLNSNRLTINGATIDISTAMLDGLVASDLQVGLDIISSGVMGANSELQAAVIRLDPDALPLSQGTSINEQGRVSSVSNDNLLVVNGRSVRVVGGTQISDGVIDSTFAELSNILSNIVSIDDRVVVDGVVNSEGIILASSLAIVRQDNLLTVTGAVEDIILDQNRFMVNGLFLDFTDATLATNSGAQTTPININNLQIGQTVKVKGNQVTPQRVIVLSVTVLN